MGARNLRYRTAVGMLEVESVDVIPESKITNADAKRSGYPSAAAVIADLRGTDDLPIYRIRFHAASGATGRRSRRDGRARDRAVQARRPQAQEPRTHPLP